MIMLFLKILFFLMRWITSTNTPVRFLKKNKLNNWKLHFFLFRFYKQFIFCNKFSQKTTLSYLNVLNTIFFKCLLQKKTFLIIDDFTLTASSLIYNFFFFNDFFFLYRYLIFIYSKSKSKKLFIFYLKQFIFLKNIQFIFFLNESFFYKYSVLFNRLNIPKVGFTIKRLKYSFLDYNIFVPNNFNFNYFILFYFTSLRFVASNSNKYKYIYSTLKLVK